MRKEALIVGANAVIAIDLDYQEISGAGKLGMLMLVASGTAVKLKDLPYAATKGGTGDDSQAD